MFNTLELTFLYKLGNYYNMKTTLLTLAYLTSQACAFVTSPVFMKTSNVALRSSTGEDAIDPFDAYTPGATKVAIRETASGSGEPSNEGDVLSVSYKGRLFNTGVPFHETELFKFKLGGDSVMPGFTKGLVGAKEGSKRTIRIPPSLAYGEKGKKGSIPPNSDLEFDVEITKVSRGFAGELELFGVNRALGITACVAVMAFTPMVEKALM